MQFNWIYLCGAIYTHKLNDVTEGVVTRSSMLQPSIMSMLQVQPSCTADVISNLGPWIKQEGLYSYKSSLDDDRVS